jgi:hypothetical protein
MPPEDRRESEDFMPTNRYVRTRKPRSAMTALELRGMVTGCFWFDEAAESRKPELWHDHREEIEREWFSLQGLFSRCWAWWKFEAPEPRRRIGGEGIAATDTPDCPACAKKLSFGRPTVWDADYADETETWFETQRDYLIRLDLLTPEEKRILKTAAGGSGIQ